MTECQGCGAWNDANRSVCVLCGTPLAETDEWDAEQDLPPLPPLPDGGLEASMPAWLRALPELSAEEEPPPPAPAPPTAPASNPLAASALGSVETLGPRADPRTFLTDDDFPRWLRDLAAREARLPSNTGGATTTLGTERWQPPEWPAWPGLPPAPDPGDGLEGGLPVPPAPAVTVTSAEDLPPAAIVVARALEERRPRSPWETLLLVLLVIGVIVAALWALVSNGVFSPSL